MFRGRLGAVLGLVLMLAASSAEARELGLSIDGRVGGDSNVLRSGFRKVADAFVEIAPRFSLRENQSELTYDFDYFPIYTAYAETNSIDGFDHIFRGSGTWQATSVDTVSFQSRYEDRRQLRFDDADETDTIFLVPGDRRRIRRTTANANYSRQLTPTWSAFLSLDLDDFDQSADDRGSQPDSRAYTGRLGANHAFTSRTTGGLSVSGRFRDTRAQLSGFVPTTPDPEPDGFDPRDPLFLPPNPSAKALIWDLSVNLSHQISETASISLQVGPSFISTELIPDIAQRPRDKTTYTQDTSIFAAATFEKRWERARFSLAYVRSEFRGGFFTSSTLSDDVNLNIVYEWSRRLTARVNGRWNQREQIVSVADVSDTLITQWRTSFTLNYRLSRQMNLIAQYAFSTQEIESGDVSSPVLDTHTGFISLRYTFDPIIF